MDLARSKAPWCCREGSRGGGSEARLLLLLLGGETGEEAPEGGEPRRERGLLLGGSHVGCKALVKGIARRAWMM
jgi:hypothetical protein